jgi:uncharacterized membrane protein YdjX (TVP38/TMEM64 family)
MMMPHRAGFRTRRFSSGFGWRLPAAVLAAAAVLTAMVLVGRSGQLTWAALGARQAALTAAAAAHPATAPLLFVGVYALVVVLSIPATVVMSVAAGLLFGRLTGAVAAVAGASSGAIVLFLIVRHVLRPFVARRAGRLVARLGPRLERDGFSYLLALRLNPALPFWLVNLLPALVGMRLLPFAAATLLGIVPATVVFVSLGAGLGGVLAAGGRPDVGVIFAPAVLGPLAGLAALSLLPVAWRRWRRPPRD